MTTVERREHDSWSCPLSRKGWTTEKSNKILKNSYSPLFKRKVVIPFDHADSNSGLYAGLTQLHWLVLTALSKLTTVDAVYHKYADFCAPRFQTSNVASVKPTIYHTRSSRNFTVEDVLFYPWINAVTLPLFPKKIVFCVTVTVRSFMIYPYPWNKCISHDFARSLWTFYCGVTSSALPSGSSFLLIRACKTWRVWISVDHWTSRISVQYTIGL